MLNITLIWAMTHEFTVVGLLCQLFIVSLCIYFFLKILCFMNAALDLQFALLLFCITNSKTIFFKAYFKLEI